MSHTLILQIFKTCTVTNQIANFLIAKQEAVVNINFINPICVMQSNCCKNKVFISRLNIFTIVIQISRDKCLFLCHCNINILMNIVL